MAAPRSAARDDHAGIDIGRTFTETPHAPSRDEFLAHIRAGERREPRRAGQRRQVDARRDGAGDPRARRRRGRRARPTRARCCTIVERVMREGDVRRGGAQRDLGPQDARALLRAWLGRDGPRDRRAQAARAAPGRRAQPRRPVPPRPPRSTSASSPAPCTESSRWPTGRRGARPSGAARSTLFDACVPAIPYAAAAAFLGREKSKLDAHATATGRGSRWSPTASAACTASPTRSSRSASAACPASTSR